MFEKEARKWVKEHTKIDYKASYGEFPIEPSAIKSFKAGAEFGYNKANEWNFTHRNKKHQVIDCPKGEENKLYLLLLNSRDSKEYEFGKKIPVVCYWNEEWCRFERLEHTIGERNVNPNDINAWKEIVLPELKEGE